MTLHPIQSDKRYEINQEYTGHASGKPVYVLRWCGDYIASSEFLSPLILRALGHKAMRNGSPGIEEIKPVQL